MSEIQVRLADWQKDNADLRRIRETVFIAEQAVPPELEWDAEDADAAQYRNEDECVRHVRVAPDENGAQEIIQ